MGGQNKGEKGRRKRRREGGSSEIITTLMSQNILEPTKAQS